MTPKPAVVLLSQGDARSGHSMIWVLIVRSAGGKATEHGLEYHCSSPDSLS